MLSECGAQAKKRAEEKEKEEEEEEEEAGVFALPTLPILQLSIPLSALSPSSSTIIQIMVGSGVATGTGRSSRIASATAPIHCDHCADDAATLTLLLSAACDEALRGDEEDDDDNRNEDSDGDESARDDEEMSANDNED